MRFVARSPGAPLDAVVSLVWHATRRDAPAMETVLPSGQPQLVIQLDGRPNRWSDAHGEHVDPAELVGGPFVGPLRLPGEAQHAVAGALFHPGGLAALLDMPICELRGAYAATRDLWGSEVDRWTDRVRRAPTAEAALQALESGLRSHLGRRSRRAALELACRRLARGEAVRAVAERLGASQRRFSRTFTNEVGLTPKQFTRLARFRRALAAIRAQPRRDLTEVALEAGFFDQAHLTREFRAFGGLTPSAYREALGPYASHVQP